jgi:hypothetical protein
MATLKKDKPNVGDMKLNGGSPFTISDKTKSS